MRGTKYLSELVNTEMFQTDKLNVIKAPTGSGKTYFALKTIAGSLPDATHKSVYLIDTVNGQQQILKNYGAQAIYGDWEEEVDEKWISFEDNSQIVVITYAKFGVILEKNPDFHQRFDYIICDELPSLFKFEYYSPKPNIHSSAHDGIERAVRNGRTKVIALSATPESIKKRFKAPFYEVPFDDKDLIQYETKEIILYTNLYYLMSTFDTSETGICYTSHITDMKQFESEVRKMGLNPISIWSIRNTENPMTQEQLDVRREILDNFTLPEKYNFLIINASSETSLKIKSHVDYVIVNSKTEETQIQVRGRVNNDLSRLYLPSTETDELVVPEEFLARRLFTEDKNKLCDILNQRNEYGRRYSWPSIRERLIESGYSIVDGRSHNLRYATIFSPAE